jgi:hypothetical protein
MMEEWLGHLDLNLARRILHGERRLRDQLRYDRRAQPTLVRVNDRPGEMLEGFEAWQVAAIGFVAVRFYDTETVEYFTPEQWATAKREMIV